MQRLVDLIWTGAEGSFDGTTSRARHDNAFDLVSLAVFAEPGPHPARDTFADIKSDTILPVLVAAVVAALGFEVSPTATALISPAFCHCESRPWSMAAQNRSRTIARLRAITPTPRPVPDPGTQGATRERSILTSPTMSSCDARSVRLVMLDVPTSLSKPCSRFITRPYGRIGWGNSVPTKRTFDEVGWLGDPL
jgi:hypothetical protein